MLHGLHPIWALDRILVSPAFVMLHQIWRFLVEVLELKSLTLLLRRALQMTIFKAGNTLSGLTSMATKGMALQTPVHCMPCQSFFVLQYMRLYLASSQQPPIPVGHCKLLRCLAQVDIAEAGTFKSGLPKHLSVCSHTWQANLCLLHALPRRQNKALAFSLLDSKRKRSVSLTKVFMFENFTKISADAAMWRLFHEPLVSKNLL